MDKKILPHGYWTKDRVFEESKKYSSKSEFHVACGQGYKMALENGWFNEMTWLPARKVKWTKEKVLDEARKYSTNADFQRNNKSAYNAAYKNGWLKDINWFKPYEGKWTYDVVYQIACKYTKLLDFSTNESAAYNAACRNKWLPLFTWLQKTTRKFWTKNKVMKAAKPFDSRTAFRTGNSKAYRAAVKEGWINEITWFKPKKQSRTWNKESVFEESKKYSSRWDFGKNCHSGYSLALENGWLDEMTWLGAPNGYNSHQYVVYAYVDEENLVAYVGLTRQPKDRHIAHSTGWSKGVRSYSAVFNYFCKIKKSVPEPIYLENNLDVTEARRMEDYWLHQYKDRGYVMLNKGKTGENCGSIGGFPVKWTKKRVFEESKKYKYRWEFGKNSPAYQVATKNGWIQEMTWLEAYVPVPKKWTKKAVMDEAHKYTKYREFTVFSRKAYNAAQKNGWLSEMTWLEKREPSKKWTKEEALIESKKYKYKEDFNNDNPSCYRASVKYGWIKEMIWLGSKPHGPIKWSRDAVFEESRKYTSLYDFRNKSQGAYNKAKSNKWLDEMTWLSKTKIKKPSIWSKEAVFAEAKKYEYKKEFQKEKPSAYYVARQNKWLTEMNWFKTFNFAQPRYWTKDKVFEVARKYKTLRDFSKHNSGACQSARKYGWIKEMSWLERRNKEWTEEMVFEESHKYTSRTDFRNGNSKAYVLAYNNGWLERMPWIIKKIGVQKKWTKEAVIIEAKKYKTAREFRMHNASAYDVAKSKGWFDELTWLLPRSLWTKEKVIEEAKKYRCKSEFAKGSSGAYDAAHRNHWLKDLVFDNAPSRIKWTRDVLIAESKKYKSRKEFELGNIQAYRATLKLHLLYEISAINNWGKPRRKDDFKGQLNLFDNE